MKRRPGGAWRCGAQAARIGGSRAHSAQQLPAEKCSERKVLRKRARAQRQNVEAIVADHRAVEVLGRISARQPGCAARRRGVKFALEALGISGLLAFSARRHARGAAAPGVHRAQGGVRTTEDGPQRRQPRRCEQHGQTPCAWRRGAPPRCGHGTRRERRQRQLAWRSCAA
jgi:hypothetical protein